jgi:hypothetical protein
MIDLFVILTPILLLGVIALLGFIGCNQFFGLQDVQPRIGVNSISPQSGSTQGGTRVRITGGNFDPAATVTFDTLPATSVDVSGDIINATTPGPHSSGPVDVTVTNPDGNSGTLAASDPASFSYAAVTNIGQTLIVSGVNNAGGATAQASVAFLDSPKLVVVTVFWPTVSGTLASLTITGGSFQTALKTDVWSGYNVQTFYAEKVMPSSNVAVTATLSSPTTASPWNMCVTVYDNVNASSPMYAPNSLNSVSTTTITPITVDALDASDLIYAVAIAQTAGGAFITSGSLSAGPNFTPEQSAAYVLIEDQQTTAAGPISVTASTAGTNTGRWYLLAAGIRHL